MPDCDRVGDIMSDAEVKTFTECWMPMGTVRWSGDASKTTEANIFTRLGVEDDHSMPGSDWITGTHFYLVSAGDPTPGADTILRRAASASSPTLRLFYRRGTG